MKNGFALTQVGEIKGPQKYFVNKARMNRKLA
jgi:hypothetical protein